MRGADGSRSVARLVFACSSAVVGYTFAGYPAIMALAARLRPRPVAADPSYLPRICLVIAAYNEEDVIERKLAETLALDYPRERLQVVVVADGSDDATVRRARRFAGVTVLFEPERRGKLAALNRAFGATDSDVIVFTDANNRTRRPRCASSSRRSPTRPSGSSPGARRSTTAAGASSIAPRGCTGATSRG